MSSEGLPVDGVVSVGVDLGPRNTEQAVDVAKSSLSADSAAHSADAAFNLAVKPKTQYQVQMPLLTVQKPQQITPRTSLTPTLITSLPQILMGRLRALLEHIKVIMRLRCFDSIDLR